MDTLYEDVAKLMIERKRCVALTGAGVSAESGISTFRSRGGLWEKYDPAVYASIEVFRRDPSKYWSIRGDFIRDYDSYQPNNAHLALAELEKMGILQSVVTQNIDGLHTKAGSKRVIEVHGTIREINCLKCRKQYIAPHVPEGTPPYCESCGGVLKPNTVLFGEQLPPDALMNAQNESLICNVMLVIGTSANVYPAAALPELALQHGAAIVEVNIERAFPSVDYYLGEKAGTALPKLVDEIRKQSSYSIS
ncbi:MAG: NAD-dependent protein deacylase [Candidatus Aminicenantes bacterium]|nr:NAD-dependent protein deacylase [Candidatus Aminicenantes bacterium]NIM78061.1 NAD-dependent protein deacylase [Candidatus Aminicenantes bacterium]NIN17378.1 NAD-dependent protein deacylase [Candidatus Aminicenantes bacterium]NIN41271.1 NAD-dependent protein deacylase [Candidatus Aminicenantes bacterium]NIN84044.1 NAD-dependent protein deacylase [Candidatus Aminicenantes bacterium]